MRHYWVKGSVFVVLIYALASFQHPPISMADEAMRYDRHFEVKIAQRPAPAPVSVGLREEKILYDRLKKELYKPIDPDLGPDIRSHISE
jgi:hypothetical protein